MEKGYLILADGQVFDGQLLGAKVTDPVAGEAVFTTGMGGYLETLTNPSLYGQIIVQTFPLMGNYGFIAADLEHERPHLSAWVVHQLCDTPSNFRSEGPLEAWLAASGVPCLAGVDTRRLTRTLREEGVMNGMISTAPELTDDQWKLLRGFAIENAIEAVTCRKSTVQGESGPLVVLYDFGARAGIARELLNRGCRVATVPAGTPGAEVLAMQPDGIFLSSGPGDPADNPAIIRNLKFLMGSGVPIFGICLGHQLLALAAGGRTRKMRYGHRGENQPVQHTRTGRAWITSQSHGYCVIGESLPSDAFEMYKNANDGTCEGIQYQSFPGFSVQFYPKTAEGPANTGFLFDEFIEMMREVKVNAG